MWAIILIPGAFILLIILVSVSEGKKDMARKKEQDEIEAYLLSKLDEIDFTIAVSTNTSSAGGAGYYSSTTRTTFLIIYKDGSRDMQEINHGTKLYYEYTKRLKLSD